MLLALLAGLVGSVLLAVPVAAAEKVVTITADGVSPKVLQVARGDVITFVNEDASFGYRARATSDNWDLDSGPVGLLPGRRYTHDEPITESGTYTYLVAEGEAYEGAVVLPGPSPAPSPSKSAGTSPKPSPTGPRQSPSPASSPTAGSGTAQPPVTGGLGTVDTDPSPAPGGVAPPPAIALPELPGESAGPTPDLAPEPDDDTVVTAIPGRLGSPPTSRGYGLPAALAAVLAAGVASLLVRLLLAQPAARRRAEGSLSAPTPVATVD